MNAPLVPARAAPGILLTALFLAGCGEGAVLVSPPPADSAGGGGNGGTVQKATLTVTVRVAPEDSAVAVPLGWTGGLVPGGEVAIGRLGSTGTTQTAVTGPDGEARFRDLLPGNYSVSVLREITAEERARLAAGDADVTAFAGGLSLNLAAPSGQATASLAAGRRGSLVFSEVYGPNPEVGVGNYYVFGHYVELTNNSDTTIYLDGKAIGLGQSWRRDYSRNTCDVMQKWRLDPEGIWTAFWFTFPGSGTRYPLRAGASVVVATDAIDHRAYVAGLQDLSRARFEFIGSQDVDNPAVPNMITSGREWAAVLGHGALVPESDFVLFVSEPVRKDELVVDYLPVADPEYYRIPIDKILDVISTGGTPTAEAGSIFALCPELIHPTFDRRHAQLYDSQLLVSIKRKLFATLDDGRNILQRTRTSARDFKHGQPTPGRLP